MNILYKKLSVDRLSLFVNYVNDLYNVREFSFELHCAYKWYNKKN